jgi:hypothetical protein
MEFANVLNANSSAIKEKDIGMALFMDGLAAPALVTRLISAGFAEQEGSPARCQLDIAQSGWCNE